VLLGSCLVVNKEDDLPVAVEGIARDLIYSCDRQIRNVDAVHVSLSNMPRVYGLAGPIAVGNFADPAGAQDLASAHLEQIAF
jgi:hypothetical protein